MKKNISSDTKNFLLTLLATTFSIILTFGTSAIIDRRHKEAAKKEMVMMIIYDFDKTIEQVQYADSVFRQAFKAQQDAILHPEHFNSHYSTFMASVRMPSFIRSISIVTIPHLWHLFNLSILSFPKRLKMFSLPI